MKKIEMKLILGGVVFAESSDAKETIYFYKGKDSKKKGSIAKQKPVFTLNDGTKILHYTVKEAFKKCEDDLVQEKC